MTARLVFGHAAIGLIALSAALVIAPSPVAAGSAAIQLAQADLVQGEVRKVDIDAQKITIRHGPIAKYDMDAMTMVFRVADPAMLKQVAQGDKVLFDIDRGGGAMTITTIKKAN